LHRQAVDADGIAAELTALPIPEFRRTPAIVMLNPLTENSSQMSFTQRDQMVNTLTPCSSDEPLTMRIGLGRPRRRLEDFETECIQAFVERG
jgi:hypothetical protein